MIEAAPRGEDWSIDLEQVDDGYIVKLTPRGVSKGVVRRFIACDLNDAIDKIRVGLVVNKMET